MIRGWMNKIVVGTTPKIRWRFSKISVSDIVKATMTIKRYGTNVVVKDIDSAIINDDEITYSLSQSETLDIGVGTCEIMLNWVTNNGVRGASGITHIEFTKNHINEVL